MPAKHRVWFEDQHHLMEALACTICGLPVLVREGRQNHSFGIRYPRGRLLIVSLQDIGERLFSANYVQGLGLDDGQNKFLELVKYRLNGHEELGLVRVSGP